MDMDEKEMKLLFEHEWKYLKGYDVMIIDHPIADYIISNKSRREVFISKDAIEKMCLVSSDKESELIKTWYE